MLYGCILGFRVHANSSWCTFIKERSLTLTTIFIFAFCQFSQVLSVKRSPNVNFFVDCIPMLLYDLSCFIFSPIFRTLHWNSRAHFVDFWCVMWHERMIWWKKSGSKWRFERESGAAETEARRLMLTCSNPTMHLLGVQTQRCSPSGCLAEINLQLRHV